MDTLLGKVCFLLCRSPASWPPRRHFSPYNWVRHVNLRLRIRFPMVSLTNSMQLSFLPHPIEPTGLTARVSHGVVATVSYSSTSLLVLVFRHTDFSSFPSRIRLSRNLTAGPLSQPEAVGVPVEILGHVHVEQHQPVRRTASCLPAHLCCFMTRFYGLCFFPSGDMHTVANQNINPR